MNRGTQALCCSVTDSPEYRVKGRPNDTDVGESKG